MALANFLVSVLVILPSALAGNCNDQTNSWPNDGLCIGNPGYSYHCHWEALNVIPCSKQTVTIDCDDSKVDGALAGYGDCSVLKEGTADGCNYAVTALKQCSPGKIVTIGGAGAPGCYYDTTAQRLLAEADPQMV
jgi:hypothetical protein